MTDFIQTSLQAVKPLDKIQQTKPQESRARKLENRKAVTITRIVSKFKTSTIVYSTLQKSADKIGRSTHIITCRAFIGAKITVHTGRAFHSGFFDNEKRPICKTKRQWRWPKNPPFKLNPPSWTCFPPISIDKNGKFSCCLDAIKLHFMTNLSQFDVFQKLIFI